MKSFKPILVLEGEELTNTNTNTITNKNENEEQIEINVKEKKKNTTIKKKVIKGQGLSRKKPVVFIFEEKESEQIPNLINKKQKSKKRRLKTDKEFIIMDDPIIEKKRLNDVFIDLLEKLSTIMLKQGEIFRAKAYQKAQETILDYPNDIFSPDQLKGLPGIGQTIMEKLNEFVNTGTLKVIEREKNNPINKLTEVYGIGPKKANELVKAGITNLYDLKEKQNELLNDVQKIGLKLCDDWRNTQKRKSTHRFLAVEGLWMDNGF
jgi:predicted flap endonuclease-1-like 5' DNA nuclease